MNVARTLLDLAALPLRLRHPRRPQPDPGDPSPRILVIRRNRMGDMIYTLPLLHALRKHYAGAHLVVACDPPGLPIARACDAVDEVILLETGWNRWVSAFTNAARLQGFDWVVAAKGGFDRRVALLADLTNAPRRIGFEHSPRHPSLYFTDPVAMPIDPHAEHQIETLLRLLQPFGIVNPVFLPETLQLHLPQEALDFADKVVTAPPFHQAAFALINLSCNRPMKFKAEDYAAVIHRLLKETSLAIGIVGAPADQAATRRLAEQFPSDRVAAVATPGTLDFAALLERAAFFLTPEGGAAHLSSATRTPTVVLWHGAYGKWRPRGERHVLVKTKMKEPRLPVERVWEALLPFLG